MHHLSTNDSDCQNNPMAGKMEWLEQRLGSLTVLLVEIHVGFRVGAFCPVRGCFVIGSGLSLGVFLPVDWSVLFCWFVLFWQFYFRFGFGHDRVAVWEQLLRNRNLFIINLLFYLRIMNCQFREANLKKTVFVTYTSTVQSPGLAMIQCISL